MVSNAVYLSYVVVSLGMFVGLRRAGPLDLKNGEVECGKLTSSDTTLMLGDHEEIKVPWHAKIYSELRHLNQIYIMFRCSGTIITSSGVISAAGCFWLSQLHELDSPSYYAVAGGKLYNDWADSRDVAAQKIPVEDIKIPAGYDGNAFTNDISFVILSKPFVFDFRIRPVCLSFDTQFDTRQLTPGNIGSVAAKTYSTEVVYLKEMIYLHKNACLANIPDWKVHDTSDKMCGQYKNESILHLTRGVVYIGEGWAFPATVGEVQRFYLRGVHIEDLINIDRPQDPLFMHLLSHEKFIRDNLATTEHPRNTSLPCRLPPQPEHGRYAAAHWPDARPGDSFWSFHLNYTCDVGYDLNGTNDIWCSNGTWSESMPRCDIGRPRRPECGEDACPAPGVPSHESTCRLPAQPEHGHYAVPGRPDAHPGDSLGFFQLNYTCDIGYGIVGKNTVYCFNGYWSEALPLCERFCRLNFHPSVEYMCPVPATNGGTRPCNRYEPNGTQVLPVCRTPNYYSPQALFHMTCIESNWDYVATCLPECGRVTPIGYSLIIDGRPAERGELPWHAGVYQKKVTFYKQICGGSIISTTSIVSAAHCFGDDGLQPASNYAVAVGKIYRRWSDPRDSDAQRSDVAEIKLPSTYRGTRSNYQSDIALLMLSTTLVYQPHVRPICLNFDVTFSSRQLQPGRLAKVAGWGYTSANSTQSSEKLKVVELPYVNFTECLAQVPDTFSQYMTLDKICAGYTNGTALCRGDSGGGLAFPTEDERGVRRYYLRGVVSTAPTSDMACNAFAITTFTQITSHENFIKGN